MSCDLTLFCIQINAIGYAWCEYYETEQKVAWLLKIAVWRSRAVFSWHRPSTLWGRAFVLTVVMRTALKRQGSGDHDTPPPIWAVRETLRKRTPGPRDVLKTLPWVLSLSLSFLASKNQTQMQTEALKLSCSFAYTAVIQIMWNMPGFQYFHKRKHKIYKCSWYPRIYVSPRFYTGLLAINPKRHISKYNRPFPLKSFQPTC